MFKNLTNFSYKRTALEAVGFYIFYLILGGLIAGLLGAIVGFGKDPQLASTLGRKIGALSVVVYCSLLAIIIIGSKKLYTNAIAIILFVLTPICSLILGGLFGCIPLALLSMLNNSEG